MTGYKFFFWTEPNIFHFKKQQCKKDVKLMETMLINW